MAESSRGIRSFIAVNLPSELLNRIGRFQDDLREVVPGAAVRWTRADQIHLTLRFLGNVPEAALPELSDALRRACQTAEPFHLRALGAGCFPDLRRPKIVWVGLTGSNDALAQLQGGIARATEQWGEREDREFHPHLTLGRMKQPDPRAARAIAQALEQAGNVALGEWQVEGVDLMRSDLSSTGPRYSLLTRVTLEKKA